MKAVKIIVVIVTVLILGFVAIGFIVPEVQYQSTIQIDKPVDQVFSMFTDVEKAKDWIPEIKSVSVVQQQPNQVGSEYNVVISSNGQEVAMKQKVLEFAKNKSVKYRYNVGGMLKLNDFQFVSEGSSTQVTQTTTVKSSEFLMSSMLPLFKSKLKEQDQMYLQGLKKYIE